jgi:hypothetical protein
MPPYEGGYTFIHDITRIQTDMDFCDRNGDKVGSVGEVYSMAGAARPASGATRSGSSGSDWFVKVDTGFLGLRKDLYIPARAVANVPEDRLVLDVDKGAIDTVDWDEKPELPARLVSQISSVSATSLASPARCSFS